MWSRSFLRSHISAYSWEYMAESGHFDVHDCDDCSKGWCKAAEDCRFGWRICCSGWTIWSVNSQGLALGSLLCNSIFEWDLFACSYSQNGLILKICTSLHYVGSMSVYMYCLLIHCDLYPVSPFYGERVKMMFIFYHYCIFKDTSRSSNFALF